MPGRWDDTDGGIDIDRSDIDVGGLIHLRTYTVGLLDALLDLVGQIGVITQEGT